MLRINLKHPQSQSRSRSEIQFIPGGHRQGPIVIVKVRRSEEHDSYYVTKKVKYDQFYKSN